MFNLIRNFVAGRKFRKNVATVTAALSGKYEFRSRTALARKIGTTDPVVLDGILDAIGVRGMYGNPDMVGLIARIGATPRRRRDLHEQYN